MDQIEAAVYAALGPSTLADVSYVATLDAKAGEPALAAFCERHRIPLVTFSPAEIQGCFDLDPSLQRSSHVHAHLGVDGVCEPCALLAAKNGTLIRKKQALDGVTVAVAGPAIAGTHERAHKE